MLLLETELPDELMQGGPSSWDHNVVTNKPPAQGPGPGPGQMYQQINGGEDSIVSANVASLQRQQQQHQQQQQQLAHLLQQKTTMVPNPHLNALKNNSPIQSGPNATNVMNNLGVSMPLSMAPNNNGTNNTISMQGEFT
jgi:TolA-binding protein